MNSYLVTDEDGVTCEWTAQELLHEVNRDRSEEWTDYTIEDLKESPTNLLEWVYYLAIERKT